jgi:Coenzyme PQQ synthesis protein D (PqqD)
VTDSVVSLDSVVSRIADDTLMVEALDDEVVMLRLQDGLCFGLNRMGSVVWRHLDREISIAGVCDALLAEYEVDRMTCETQVLAIIESLQSERLVLVRQP